VRKVEDVRRLLNAGADKSRSIPRRYRTRALVREASGIVGNQCIVVAIDAKRGGFAGRGDQRRQVGGLHATGARQSDGIDAVQWAKRMPGGRRRRDSPHSMDRDGTRDGFDVALTRAVSGRCRRAGHRLRRVGTMQH